MQQAIPSVEEIDILNERAWELRSAEIEEPMALSHRAYEVSQQIGYDQGLVCSQRNLGYLYSRLCEFEQALQSLKNSAAIAEKMGDLTLISSINNNLGVLYMNQGKYPEALEIFKKNLPIIEETQNPVAKALTLNNIGNIYWAQENFPEMLKSYFDALHMYEAIGEESGMATIYNNIGNTYKILQDYENARHHYEKSLRIQQRFENLIGVAVAQSNIAMVHLLLKDFAKSHELYLEALATQQLLSDDQQKARIYIGLGMACKGMERYNEALRHLHRALEISRKIEAREQEAITLLELGSGYFSMQDYPLAITYLEEVIQIPGQNPENYLAHKILSDIAAQKGDFKKAYEHHRQFHDGYESHKNVETDERFKKLYLSFEIESARREKDLYRSRSEELADALMELKAVHNDLKKVSELRNEILGTVVHDLKNPLSGIILWTEVLEHQLPNGDSKQQTVENILKLANYMSAIIKELLDTGANVVDNSMQNIINLDAVVVTQEVFEASQKIAFTKNITIQHSLPDKLLIKTDPISLRRVIENLLSNAIKFSPHYSSVKLQMYKQGDYFKLIIEDQGPGISAEDQKKLFCKFSRLSARPTGGEQSTGLGLYIVNLLVTKMHGKVCCESELGQGARFIVELPINGL